MDNRPIGFFDSGLGGLTCIPHMMRDLPEEKIIYDMEYIKHRSLGMDLKIIFQTVGVVFTHKGAK